MSDDFKFVDEYKFIFTKLDDDSEGKRINRLGRPKSAYLGKHCKQVGVYPPYAMMFEDGSVWALDIEQIEPVKPYYRIVSQRYNIPVICVETGQEFMNAHDAGVSVGLVKGAINTAINSGCKAGGYHWIRKGQEL